MLEMPLPDRRLRRWIRGEHRRQAASFSLQTVVFETFTASTSTTVADLAARIVAGWEGTLRHR